MAETSNDLGLSKEGLEIGNHANVAMRKLGKLKQPISGPYC